MGHLVSLLWNDQQYRSNFLAGVLFALGSISVYKIFTFLRPPSAKAVAAVSLQAIPKAGDDSKITIWGFQEKNEHTACMSGITDVSPYVRRIECYLLLKKQEYVKVKSQGMSENPRRKLPMCNVYGKMIDDSERILSHLQEKLGDTSEKELTDLQLAQGVLIRRLLTGSLYWVFLYMGFATESGIEGFETRMKNDAPWLIRKLLAPMIIRSQIERLRGVGTTDLPPEDVIQQGKEDLRALNMILGNDTYFFGASKPTVYDTDVYAFISPIFYDSSIEYAEWVKDIRKELPSLERHSAKMRDVMFPTLKKSQ